VAAQIALVISAKIGVDEITIQCCSAQVGTAKVDADEIAVQSCTSEILASEAGINVFVI
jgi:hypothetical protein